MNSSLYPDGVVVDRSALRRTELTKAAEILRTRVDVTSRGVLSGGAITANGLAPSRIDIAMFTGFCPNGEFIESAAAALSVGLGDDTLNAVNFVCAIYTEIEDKNQPHESDGNVYPTRARPFYRVRTYEESAFLALPATDSNLANDAKDRALLLGKVTANGTGIAIGSGNITMPVVFSNVMTATPYQGVNVSGVMILEVSPDMPEGIGQLSYTYSAGPTYTFTWTSSTGGVGAAITPSVDGNYYIYDGSAVAYLKLNIVISQLPLAGTFPLIDNITIDNLYSQEIPRLTAEDRFHRDLIGTGVVTENNAHGLSLDDLAGESLQLVDEHQDVMHCNGIWKGSNPSIFNMSISPSGINYDVLSVLQPQPGDLYYINGRKLTNLLNTSILFSQAEFLAGNLGATTYEGAKLYDVYVDDDEVLKVSLRAAFPDTGRNIPGVWILDCDPLLTASTRTLTMVVTPTTYSLRISGGPNVVWDYATPASPEGQVFRLFTASGFWVDVYVNRSGTTVADGTLETSAGTYSDSIQFYNGLDYSQNMKIGAVPYWYSGSEGTLGWDTNIGVPPGTRHTKDLRPWGTLNEDNMADSALQNLVYHPNDELHFSGICLERNKSVSVYSYDFGFSYSSGLTANVRGGNYYLRGERKFIFENAVSFVASKTSLVYINQAGTMSVLNVTDDFGGVVHEALAYVSGTTLYRDPALQGYVSDSGTPEERGVPLWVVVTNATDVTSMYDISRNINGPVGDWTVASRSESLAAFDSLYAAFLWAEVYTNPAYINLPLFDILDIKLVGKSYIANNITQPSKVNVYGCRPNVASLASGTSEVSVSVDSTSTPAWTLGTRCIVNGVYLKNTYTPSGATAGVIFGVTSGCEISSCYFHCGDKDVAFSCPVGDVVGLKLLDNEVYTHVGFYGEQTWTGKTTITSEIKNNKISVYGDTALAITTSVGGVFACVIGVNGYWANISGNAIGIEHMTAVNQKYPIVYVGSSPTSGDSVIEENTVLMGELGLWGITLVGYLINLSVSDNTIKTYGTTYSQASCGIYGLSSISTNLQINNNKIIGLGAGIIHSEVGTSSSNISIDGNKISGSTTRPAARGIYFGFTGTQLSGVSISNNIISKLTRVVGATSTVPSGMSETIAGVQMALGAATSTKISNINVVNNIISGVTNARAGVDCHGIRAVIQDCDVDADLFGISILNNNISDITSARHQYAIYLGSASSNSSVLAGSVVNGNRIKSVPVVAGANTSVGVYFATTAATTNLYGCDICHNNIYTVNTSTSDTSYGVLVSGHTLIPNNINISNNNITANTYGISIEAEDSNINSNTIVSLGVGIQGVICNRTIFSGNKVRVYSFQVPLSPVGSVGIYVATGNNDFVISNSTYLLYGNVVTTLPGVGILSLNSCNVYVDNCDRFKIDGVTTQQSYATLASARAAYHMFLYLGAYDNVLASVCNCTIDNRTGVPSPTSTTHTSHGLYLDSASYTVPLELSGNVTVNNNTIYWPQESASSEWRITGAELSRGMCVRDPFNHDPLGIGAYDFRFVTYRNNKVFSKETTAGIGTVSPSAWFKTSPVWKAVDSTAAYVAFPSNMYTQQGYLMSTIQTDFFVWEEPN